MSDIPSVAKRIQEEETAFEAPVSESTLRKVGGTMNFILDHYVIPPGSSMTFNGMEDAIPLGWHPEDGRLLSRSTYANLFANIGTLWGEGDGVTTFNVPDKRGQFVRMVDLTNEGQAGVDPDHATRTPLGTGTAEDPGSYQDDEFRSHFHGVPGQGGSGPTLAAAQYFSQPPDFGNPTQSKGGAESRPKNCYVYSIIKD